jgi:4-amino-4-deoxy-L-arabinose transferase-like glycosyltransferase
MTMIFLATLPAVFFILTSIGSYKRYGEGWRDSLLRSAVTSGVTVTVVVEILGALRLLARPALAISWSLLCLAAAVWALRGAAVEAIHTTRSASTPPLQLDTLSPILFGSGLLAGCVALTAILAPPGPFDVHAYHMPRVLFWLQQRTLNHYPTPYHQELFLSPWAEFATLNVFALAGSDHLVNLVHFVFYPGSALAVYCIAQIAGASAIAQTTSAVFLLTLPQAVLTASGAKNDLTVTFWILTAVYFALRFTTSRRRSDVIFLALASALSILTKGTAYLWLPPAVFAAFASSGRRGLIDLTRCLPAIVASCLALNFPHYARNMAVFGSPFGCDAPFCGTPYKFVNADFKPRTVAANVIRHLASHATTPLPQANLLIFNGATSLIRSLGVDPQDKSAIWFGTRFEPAPYRLHEFTIGNPLHLVLIIASLVLVLSRANRRLRTWWIFTAGPILGFVAFCAAFRWQPWGTRLHLPLFALSAPLVGAALDSARGRATGAILCIFLLMQAFPLALANEVRPLATTQRNLFTVPRYQFYPHAEDARAVARALAQANCSHVALEVQHPFEIYPLLLSLRSGSPRAELTYLTQDPRFEPLYSKRALKPCAVIYNFCDQPGRSFQCRQLGDPQRFGTFWLVTGFEAQWTPKRGWEVARRAPAPRVSESDMVSVPTILRPDNHADLKYLQGAASDKWVMGEGLQVLVAAKERNYLKVRLSGDIPPGSPVLPQGIQITCGRGRAHRRVIEQEGPFELSITLECPIEDVTRLSVLPERTFRPLDFGINQDPRYLAFRVFELAILDAER